MSFHPPTAVVLHFTWELIVHNTTTTPSESAGRTPPVNCVLRTTFQIVLSKVLCNFSLISIHLFPCSSPFSCNSPATLPFYFKSHSTPHPEQQPHRPPGLCYTILQPCQCISLTHTQTEGSSTTHSFPTKRSVFCFPVTVHYIPRGPQDSLLPS